METSRIAGGRARAERAKRLLAVASVAALGATFALVRSHVHGARASSDSVLSPAFSDDEQGSEELGGGSLSPAPLDAQPQVQTATS